MNRGSIPGLFCLGAIALLMHGCGSSGDNYESLVPSPPPPLHPTSILSIADGTVAETGASSANHIVFPTIAGGTAPQSTSDQVKDTGLNDAMTGIAVATCHMADRELTIGQWQALIDATGAAVPRRPWDAVVSQKHFGDTAATTADTPVYGISHDMITTLLTAWNAQHRNKLRLPTSKEWEHACRAGSSDDFFWGKTVANAASYAVTTETTARNSGAKALPGRTANPKGLYDMLGNVWEWVSDGGTGNAPCLRGGSWKNTLLSATCGNRIDCDTATPYALAGVRLVLYQE